MAFMTFKQHEIDFMAGADLGRLAVLVEKTGGEAERAAFALLDDHVRAAARAQGLDPDAAAP